MENGAGVGVGVIVGVGVMVLDVQFSGELDLLPTEFKLILINRKMDAIEKNNFAR